MKGTVKLKKRLEALGLALLFMLQSVLGFLPGMIFSAAGAVKSIEVWDSDQLIDYGYRFNMKFQPGVIRKRVPEVLQEVGLAGKYKAFPDELSGGEQQRVALARALVNRPDILLADEPTGNLDPKTSEEIMKLLEQINDRGTTVLVVTHNKEIVNAMRKRVVTMHEGSIISDEKEGEYHEA